MAGMEVVEARINYLAYAPEIAAVMLRRQQAGAIITAREKIVEGAVSMVKMAVDKLEQEQVVQLSPADNQLLELVIEFRRRNLRGRAALARRQGRHGQQPHGRALCRRTRPAHSQYWCLTACTFTGTDKPKVLTKHNND